MAEAMKVCWARHKCHRAWRPAAVLAPSFDQNDLQLLHNPWLQHSTNVLTVGKQLAVAVPTFHNAVRLLAARLSSRTQKLMLARSLSRYGKR
jgi:hypothetical protein